MDGNKGVARAACVPVWAAVQRVENPWIDRFADVVVLGSSETPDGEAEGGGARGFVACILRTSVCWKARPVRASALRESGPSDSTSY